MLCLQGRNFLALVVKIALVDIAELGRSGSWPEIIAKLGEFLLSIASLWYSAFRQNSFTSAHPAVTRTLAHFMAKQELTDSTVDKPAAGTEEYVIWDPTFPGFGISLGPPDGGGS
jgi:hypothetical protein